MNSIFKDLIYFSFVLAAYNNRIDIVNALLTAKASPNIQLKDNQTVLIYSILLLFIYTSSL